MFSLILLPAVFRSYCWNILSKRWVTIAVAKLVIFTLPTICFDTNFGSTMRARSPRRLATFLSVCMCMTVVLTSDSSFYFISFVINTLMLGYVTRVRLYIHHLYSVVILLFDLTHSNTISHAWLITSMISYVLMIASHTHTCLLFQRFHVSHHPHHLVTPILLLHVPKL